jgi:hypothetical protein
VLAGKLSLFDIDDVFAFTAAIVNRNRLRLSYHDQADLEAFLASTCWELSLKYRPGGIPFSAFATRTLKLRIVDWQRAKFGRTKWQWSEGVTYERKRPEFVSLDVERDRLGESLAAWSGDSAPDWDAAHGGLEGDRDRTRAADLAQLGLYSDRRVA